MKRVTAWVFLTGAAMAAAALVWVRVAVHQPVSIMIDYPEEGTIFPPDYAAPTFLWRDPAEKAKVWVIHLGFADRSADIQVKTEGKLMRVGEIDPRCVAETNELPKLTPEQSAAHTWTPDAGTWAKIKEHSRTSAAAITITGLRNENSVQELSRGNLTIRTAADPVGAYINPQ